MNLTDKPLAAKGLKSYRAKTPYGYVMIGASSHADAQREAHRSSASAIDLQVWCPDCGAYEYVKA